MELILCLQRQRHVRGADPPVPGAQANDHHRDPAETQKQEDRPHLGAAGRYHRYHAQEN